jgi:HEAT repeat protein
MNILAKTFVTVAILLAGNISLAQTPDSVAESEQLKIAALESLMSAPPERALPIVMKVLESDSSDRLKSRALFVLSQIDQPEAYALLAEAARNYDGELQQEAIRMIGINGHSEAMAALADIYTSGDRDTRDAVLHAYLIADDSDAVFEIANNAADAEEFDAAVRILGAMDATEQLRALRDRGDMSGALVNAYAIAGDVESLRVLATDSSNPERQQQAVQALGMAGGPEADAIIVEIYRSAESDDLRQAALHGMMMGDNEEAVLELFRASQDAAEKRALLEVLVMMGGDSVWDIIDATLDDQQ